MYGLLLLGSQLLAIFVDKGYPIWDVLVFSLFSLFSFKSFYAQVTLSKASKYIPNAMNSVTHPPNPRYECVRRKEISSRMSVHTWAFEHIVTSLSCWLCCLPFESFLVVPWSRQRAEYDKVSRQLLLSSLELLGHIHSPGVKEFLSSDASTSHTTWALFYLSLSVKISPSLLTGHEPVEVPVEGQCEAKILWEPGY